MATFANSLKLSPLILLLLLLSLSSPHAEVEKGLFAGNGEFYGPVQDGERLDTIALTVKGEDSHHYMQWMMALFLTNPQSFYGGNMNNLRISSNLILPNPELLNEISEKESADMVQLHQDLWREKNRSRLEKQEELLLRARIKRLYLTNELSQDDNEELYQKLSQMEREVAQAVKQTLPLAMEEPETKKGSPLQQQENVGEEASKESRKETLPESKISSESGVMGGVIIFALIMLSLLYTLYCLRSEIKGVYWHLRKRIG